MATAPRLNVRALVGVFGKRGYGAEIERLRQADLEKRQRDIKRILSIESIRDGDIDAARLLMTTLGGVPRPITEDDLRQFAYLAKRLGKRFKGGITARGVIDASLKADRERSNEQIRTAVVMRAQAGTLHFITNAGPQGEASRHHVHVSFPAFNAFTASPKKSEELARAMLKGPLNFECDCSHFKFVFRYLATAGGFVHGRRETGFPRIRNPTLSGCACKHALRVMIAIEKDPNVRLKTVGMLRAAQKNDTKAQITTAAEAKAQAQKQLQQQHHAKNRAETTAEILARQSSTAAGRARAMQRAAAEAARRAEAAAAKSRRDLEAAFKKLQAAPMTKAMRDALIAKLQAMNTTD